MYHLNEGHSVFATLEVIRERMDNDGLTFDDALRDVAQHTVFTTHTPVPGRPRPLRRRADRRALGPAARSAGHFATTN